MSAVFCSIIALVMLRIAFTSANAAFYPERICKLRTKSSLNLNWKFFRNDPEGNAYEAAYNDASWETVNVPHSALYVPPTPAGEKTTLPGASTWTGIAWYRKTFTVPQGAHTQKVFLEFEGVMQSCDVYLNGRKIGGHGASGYTAFSFDISSSVNHTGENVLAVRTDCTYNWEIPPGNLPMPDMGEYPDFYLFSGLYRDVWLVCTDNVHVPLYGHKITTPQVSSSSAAVRVQTTVHNAGGAAASCRVQSVVVDATGAIVAQAGSTATVPESGLHLFDCTTAAIANPALWSPETPNLYRVFTRVFVDDREVDDQVDRFGFRTLDWRTDGGFFLNGRRYLLKGVNMHQVFAWVGNALPDSRHYEEVKLVKNMGANAIRCSHYPRDPAFYDACDELGVLCEPELPSWGGSITSYPDIFWARMDSCAQAMVNVGFNHPSIIMWGLFNEAAGNFPAQLTSLHNRIKSIDSTRFTSVVNNKTQSANQVTDVYGENYSYQPPWAGALFYNAEYHEGWMIACNRGDTVSSTTTDDCFVATCYLRSEDEYAAERYTNRWVRDILDNTGDTRPLAGGHMWCFVDYWSPCNVGNHPMGVLDHYRIPKKVFYTFQSNWKPGSTDDYPAAGLTAAKIGLEADVTALVADSTDLSRIIGSIRDASGKCVWSSAPITFEVTGPADVFEGSPVTQSAVAGKTGIIIKSKNTPGTITVTAASSGLQKATLTITSTGIDNTSLPFIWPGNNSARSVPKTLQHITIRQSGRSMVSVEFGAPVSGTDKVFLMNILGKKVVCPAVRQGTAVVLNSTGLANGVYRLQVETRRQKITRSVVITR